MKPYTINEKIVTAHRGAKGLVEHENTLESFEKAMEFDCNSIECDVRLTKDNIIIINHNPDIDNHIIKDYTYDELEKICLKLGYHLPTLTESLNLVKGKMLIDIEIKETGYENKILDEILSILSPNEFYIRSFYDSSIKKIKELNPNVKTVLLLGFDHPKHVLKTRISELFPKKRIRKCDCDYVSPYFQLLLFNYCERVHRLNKLVFVWTVDDKEQMKKILYKKHADGIVTNYPNLAIDLINKK